MVGGIFYRGTKQTEIPKLGIERAGQSPDTREKERDFEFILGQVEACYYPFVLSQ